MKHAGAQEGGSRMRPLLDSARQCTNDWIGECPNLEIVFNCEHAASISSDLGCLWAFPEEAPAMMFTSVT
jgi:hypothetical protein